MKLYLICILYVDYVQSIKTIDNYAQNCIVSSKKKKEKKRASANKVN